MKQFIAYHNVDDWGEYDSRNRRNFWHYSKHPRKRLERTIGQKVWVISGIKENHRKTYRLCGCYQPNSIEPDGEGFSVCGEGKGFYPQIELNGLSWFADLFNEQRNFSFGLSEIRSRKVIAGLQRATSQKQANHHLPEEIDAVKKLPEGAAKRILINAYERNPVARETCIRHYGYACSVCGFNFEEKYGDIGKAYIHIHHLKPLSTIAKKYKVDPLKDLRPVCPNCHAMIHRNDPPLSIEELQKLVVRRFKSPKRIEKILRSKA